MLIGKRSLYGHWVYFTYNFTYKLKIWIRQLHHRMYPDLHRWRWSGIYECGCCGFEGLYCEGCNKTIIVGLVAGEYMSPDGLTAGRWYESGF